MTEFTLIFCCALLLNVFCTLRSSDLWKKWFHQNNNGISGSGTNNDSSLSSSIGNESNKEDKIKWQTLLRKYMIVYLLATLSDWLQGPYVYALYADYGYNQHEIAVLFVAGFGSSMIFGSFIGGMADWGGRRTFILLFSLIYAASCLTKHFKNFHILMLGRLLGGVATSLLFSVFEAWLIRAHADAKITRVYLGKSFAWAAYGNSIIAICAGLVANKAASANKLSSVLNSDMLYYGGYLNPFDIALASLVLCGVACASLWDENYGNDSGGNNSSSSSGGSVSKDESNMNRRGGGGSYDGKTQLWYTGLQSAFVTTIRSQEVLLCGIISSLFEGSMYIFVFMWTPALKEVAAQQDDAAGDLPYGLIFSTFMVCCMAGSSIFSIGIDYAKGEALGVLVFAVAAMAMGTIALATNQQAKFIAMNLFECTVGMYWPIMGTLKGAIVPESKRAAIYNLYRIPLNFIVLFSLLTDLTPTQSFLLNCAMLSTATVLQLILMKLREKNGLTETTESMELDEQEKQAMLSTLSSSSPERKMESAV